MKRNVRYAKTSIKPLPTWEGEPIELKVERILTTKEPIKDGAPIIYGEKKDGVKPEHDIRTDRWEMATDAMHAVHTSKSKAKVNSKVAKNESKAETKESDGKGSENSETSSK